MSAAGQEPAWLEPVSEAEPCGHSLEGQADYVLLMASVIPRDQVQFGKFVSTPAPVKWSEVEDGCRRLLARSRDIGLLIVLIRCRVRRARAAGVRDGLTLLVDLLERFPDHIHPQARVDGEFDLAVRANALAGLADPDGLLGDIRDIVLDEHGVRRLQVRDVERAFASHRLSDALPVSSVRQQCGELSLRPDNPVAALCQAQEALQRLLDWSGRHLAAAPPNLDALSALLAPFGATMLGAVTAPITIEVEDATPPVVAMAFAPHSAADSAAARSAGLAAIVAAREWFEHAEPSSPVVVLLRQAEKLVGKRFSDVVQSIPLDLLKSWGSDER